MKTPVLRSVVIGLALWMASPLVAVPVHAEEQKVTLFSVLERLLGSPQDQVTSDETNAPENPQVDAQPRDGKTQEESGIHSSRTQELTTHSSRNQETSNPISITLDRKQTAEGFSPELEIKTPSWQRKLKANIKQKSTPGRLNVEGVIEGIGALFKIQQTDDRAFKLEGGMEGQKPFEIEGKFN